MARRHHKSRRYPRANPQGILKTNEKGFGFVTTAEGEFFIPARKMGTAFPGDLVEVARISNQGGFGPGKKPTGRIVKVLSRNNPTLIGRYEINEPFGIVIPEDSSIPYDVFTMHADNPGIAEGDIVVVRMVEYPSRTNAATGKIERVVGHEGDAGVDIDLIVAQYDLETRFPDEVLEAAANCTLDVDAALLDGYTDLTDRFVFTIDPVDARDFDDAISISQEGSNFRLGVHIADVSRYVPYAGVIDDAARRRATSVYLVDRVIPMIPESLSNGICSLVMGQNRLTMTVDLLIDPQGSILEKTIYPAVIRSDARLSYDQAQSLLDAVASSSEHISDDTAAHLLSLCELPQGATQLDPTCAGTVMDKIVQLDRLADILHRRRTRYGSIDFESVEAKVVLDSEGEPIDVRLRQRSAATECIEQAMIAANIAVADFLCENEWPGIFRVHDEPDFDALVQLHALLIESDWFAQIDAASFVSGSQEELQKALTLVKGRPEEHLVSSLMLRSMKRAVYKATCEPHYGLGAERYCHFTSPIRRYPDLEIHRMLKQLLFGRTESFEAQKNALPALAEHSSRMERVADDVARHSQEVKLIEYMQAFIGRRFSGVIAGVSLAGLFVRIENTAEGLVPIDSLGDEYFSFDPVRYQLRGTDSSKTYRLGAKVCVVLLSCDPRRRRMRFALV